MNPPPHAPGPAADRTTVAELQDRIRSFVDERRWQRFHSPKNLSMALAVEAAELMEIFQWMTQEESRQLPPDKRQAAVDEVADVLILALNIAGVLGCDPAAAVVDKLRRAARKYPAARYRGVWEAGKTPVRTRTPKRAPRAATSRPTPKRSKSRTSNQRRQRPQ